MVDATMKQPAPPRSRFRAWRLPELAAFLVALCMVLVLAFQLPSPSRELFVAAAAVVGLLLIAARIRMRAALAALRVERDKLRALADDIPNTMVFHAVREPDGRTRFTEVSAGVQALHGRSAADLIESCHGLSDLAADEDRTSLQKVEGESAGSLQPFDVVLRTAGSDGQPCWRRLLAQPKRLPEGRIAWAGIEVDSSDVKRTEAALRENQAKLAVAFQRAPVLLLVIEGGTGTVIDVNDEALRFFNATREEVLGKTAVGLGWMLAEEIERLAKAVDEGGGRAASVEVMLRTKDGSQRTALVNLEQIVLPSSHCVLIAGTDITERKRSLARLTLSEQRFRKLFESSPIGIVVVGRRQQIMLTNQRYRDLVDLSEAEIVQRGLAGLVHPEDLPMSLAQAGRVHGGETPVICFEERHVRDDGVPVCCETHVTVVRDGNGELLYSIHWLLDITDRKRADAERRQLQESLAHSQKMESVGRLAGGVAHDFNNMLSVILANAELALGTLGAVEPTHRIRAEIEGIRDAAQQSARLTKQLLAFARKESIAPRRLDLNQVVSAVLDMLARLVGENVKLNWLPGRQIWDVRMQPAHVHQMLSNLCVNARDAIAEVGNLSISTENVTIGPGELSDTPGARPGEFVRLAVRDDGCGMDSTTLKRIFEPYFTTKCAGKGTGLGLATVYGAVRQSRGFVRVESAVGAGSCFEIFIPRDMSPVEEGPCTSEPEQRPSGGETILLVEDEVHLLTVLTRMVQDQGYRVLPASTPAEAARLARLHSQEIQLLITDVVMPEMNGAALADALQKVLPSAKQLFMSGYTADVLARHLASEDNFIAKPFSAAELGARIRAILRA